jgi:uncharacterized protein (DUF3084 family)
MPDFDDIIARLDAIRDDIQEAADETPIEDPRIAELKEALKGAKEGEQAARNELKVANSLLEARSELAEELERTESELASVIATNTALQTQVDAFNSIMSQFQNVASPSS